MPRLLPNWIYGYLRMTSGTEPPQRFHLWTAITIIGAMLGRKCEVQMGPETFTPNLYCVLIGPPGVRKGTAIKYGIDLLNDASGGAAVMAPDAVTKEQLCKELENTTTRDSDEEFEIVHSSLFVVASELVNFIKENDHERLGYLCQLYDSLARFEYKTKTSGCNFIVNPFLAILGATTPNWIEIAMKQLGVGGGMTSRTIFVYANKKGRHISAAKMQSFDSTLRAKLVTDLAEIRQMVGRFKFTTDANNEYSKWYEGRYLETGIDDSRFASYWERLPGMVIKVSMVVSAAQRDDKIITDEHIRYAIRVFEHIHPTMSQAFGGLGYNPLGAQTEMFRALMREKKEAPRSYIMHVLRNQLSEYDYQRCRNALIAERFCCRNSAMSTEAGEEVLVLLEEQKVVELNVEE